MAVDTRAPDAPDREARRRRLARRRKLLRGIGKTLITMGVLILLFVAYELWGTDLIAKRSQDNLREDVAKNGFATRAVPGKALGFLRIPKLDVDVVFVEGTDVEALKRGPGHYEETPVPGQRGNVAIAGHRTTYLRPFWDLNRLRRGDIIEIETRRGSFRYEVRWQKIVDPHALWVLDPTKRNALTLTTCHPRFSARQRLVIRAFQVAGPGLPRGGGAA